MKRSKRFIALLCVLVVLIAALFAVKHIFEDKDEVVNETGSFPLTAYEADDVCGLRWTKDGMDMHFVLSGGVWLNASDAKYPADQEALSDLAKEAGELQAFRKLENAGDLSDYGLSEPEFTLEITWDGGEKTTCSQGDQTPFADGFYVSVSGNENTVYMIKEDLSSGFTADLNDLAVMEELNEIGEAVKIAVGDSLSAEYRESGDLIDDSVVWYLTDTGSALDTEAVEKLLSDILGLSWDALVDYSADEEALNEMLLTQDKAVTVCVTDADGQEFKLLVGAVNEEGDYYARLDGSNMVYTLSGNVKNVLDAKGSDMLCTSVAPVGFDEVSEIVFTLTDKAYTVLRTETAVPATNEEAEEEISVTVTVNGDTDLTNAAQSAWELTSALSASGYPEDETGRDWVFGFAVTLENGKSAEFSVYECSFDQYIIKSSDGRTMLADADKIDEIIRSVKQLG